MALSHWGWKLLRPAGSYRNLEHAALYIPPGGASSPRKVLQCTAQRDVFPQGPPGAVGVQRRFARTTESLLHDDEKSGFLQEGPSSCHTNRPSSVAKSRLSGGPGQCQPPGGLKKSRTLATRRWSGGLISAAYDAQLCLLTMSYSPGWSSANPASEETAAAAATAGRLLRASSVLGAAERKTSSIPCHLDPSAISALVTHAFADGPTSGPPQAIGYPTKRHVVSFHLPSLSPAGLSELVYLCSVGLGIRDCAFFKEASSLALWQLQVLQRPRQSRSQEPAKADSRNAPLGRTFGDFDTIPLGVLEDFATQVVEAPVKSPPKPSAHRIVKLLRALLHAGYEDPQLFEVAVNYLTKQCTYTHSEVLHAAALLRVMPPGRPRNNLAQSLAERLMLRERRLPLRVAAAAANVFSLVSVPRGSAQRGDPQGRPQGVSEGDSLASKRQAPCGQSCSTEEGSYEIRPVYLYPSLSVLYASLARSAKRALEVNMLGIGGRVRGRDLALLARGFVRAGEHAAATPWVAAMEEHWKGLRPCLDPQSLLLLLVSLPKLQQGLP